MSTALRIAVGKRTCVVPVEETRMLVGQLREVGGSFHAAALNAAVFLEVAADKEFATSVVLTPPEEAALRRALSGLEVRNGALPEGLQRLSNAVRLDN
jgi:hypothetical protein